MPIEILMPALSPTMTEGNLAKWHKKEGEAVTSGDVLAEIETDKATMEIEAVDDGTLGKILIAEGTEAVPVNQVIALLLADGEDDSALADAGSPQPIAPIVAAIVPEAAEPDISPLARRIAEQAGIDPASLTGTGSRGRVVRADVEAAIGSAPAPAPAPAPVAAPVAGMSRIIISPIAARMAAEAGLDPAGIIGTGTGGRIVKADVEAAKAAGTATPAVPVTAPVVAPAAEGDDFTTVPLNTMRKVIAERMAFAKQTVPHFYLSMDCEIDELLKERKILNTRDPELKLSVNDFIIRAVALALMEVPDANVAWDDGAMRQYRTADISVAVSIEDGLITPIVRGAEAKGLGRISTDMKDLAARARDGKLAPEEYQGGSFTISNLGMFGVKQFDAVINTPQACILAVGAGEPRAVARDGELAVATVMTITLSCDHRVVDGATGAKLLGAIKRLLEYPPAMLL